MKNNVTHADCTVVLATTTHGASVENNSISPVADFFTRFLTLTQENLGHISGRFHHNIFSDSKL